MRLLHAALVLGALLPGTPALAWWDEGHMQIAAVAYDQLTAPAKERADVLLKMNPDYSKWIAGAPDQATAKQWAFVHAATWADDIKTAPYGYRRDHPDDASAGQNVGYLDLNQHDYWHYKDLVFSPDGSDTLPPNKVDAVTQMTKMIAALPASSDANDPLRSYDLVWLLHLVGDMHQPLHAVGRFTKELPNGDRGGNEEKVIPATGETIALHAYWDRIFGGYSSVYGALFDARGPAGIKSIAADADKAKIIDPAIWTQESFDLAKIYAYASPVSMGKDPTQLTRDYETNARNVARSQAALAGARLAKILNTAFQ